MSEGDRDRLPWTESDRDEPPKETMDAMFSQLEGRLASRTRAERLADLPTPARAGIAAAIALAIIGVVTLLAARRHLGEVPLPQLLASCGLYALALGAAAVAVLRPVHRPTLATGNLWARLGLGVAVLAGVAVAPWLEGTRVPEDPVRAAFACLAYGTALSAPLFLMLRALDRGQRMGRWLTAIAAGAFGNLVLQLHCPSDDPTHRLVGHATVAVALLAVAGVLVFRRRVER